MMSVLHCSFETPRTAVSDQEAHVYSVSLTGSGPWESFLTEEEQTRAARFRIDRMRHQFVAARGRLRSLLGTYLDLPPRSVPLTYEENGKPVLPGHLGLHFNLSHADGLAVLAVARHRVGVDVERVRDVPDADHLVARFFSPREHEEYRRLQAGERINAFMRAWTRKEAVLKAIGRGILSLDTCEVTFTDDARLRCLDGDPAAAHQWELDSWEPMQGFTAAIALERKHGEG